MDYYKILYINRANFSKERLDKIYVGFIELWNASYEKYKNDPKALLKLNDMKEQYERAYSILSDDKKRKEYDDFLEKEKNKRDNINEIQKEINDDQEKYSCFKMYDSSLIESVRYRRNTIGDISFLPYEFKDKESIRNVNCKLKGFISYSTDVKMVSNKLARYEVKTISTRQPETKKYTVITPVIDYNKVCDDPEYRKVIYEKLFSEENLEKSKHENCEYLGKVVNRDGRYGIDYDQEEFCASVRFGIKLKRRVDNPKKIKKGIKGKFKRLTTKLIGKFKNYDYER